MMTGSTGDDLKAALPPALQARVTALRFATVWGMRLSGASMAAIWPIAEQGAYLTTFVAAIVAWGWHARARRA